MLRSTNTDLPEQSARVTTLNLGDVRMTSVTSEMTSDRNDGSRVVPYRARAPYGDNGVPGSRSAASGFLIQTPGQYKINKKLRAVSIEISPRKASEFKGWTSTSQYAPSAGNLDWISGLDGMDREIGVRCDWRAASNATSVSCDCSR